MEWDAAVTRARGSKAEEGGGGANALAAAREAAWGVEWVLRGSGIGRSH